MLYELEPELTVLWAHAGMSEPVGAVAAMLDGFSTLYAELSFREHAIVGAGGLDPAWAALLTRHADRFVVGSDTWITSRWHGYRDLIEAQRRCLRLLPPEVAERIAHGNAQRLCGTAAE